MTANTRLLDLLSLLQQRRYWPGEDLAQRLDVSMRTLRRDIDQLREMGYPVEAARGLGGGYQLAAGGSLPPLVVDEHEAVALVLGLQKMMTEPVGGMDSAAVRVLAKIVQVMPKRLRRRVESLRSIDVALPSLTTQPPTVDVDTLALLAQARRDAETIAFSYSDKNGNTSQRRAEPHHIVQLDRLWYLVSYDLDKSQWRTFRLDRIEHPKRLRHPFLKRRLPNEQSPSEYIQAQRSTMKGQTFVEVLIQAPSSEVQDVVGRWGNAAQEESSTRLTMRVDDLAWVALILGSVGQPFTVITPTELERYLSDWARQFTDSTKP